MATTKTATAMGMCEGDATGGSGMPKACATCRLAHVSCDR
jgi:hypothetical protein